MTRLTTQEIEAIRKRAESGIPWGGSIAQYTAIARIDITYLLAEVEALKVELSELNDEIRVQAERDDME